MRTVLAAIWESLRTSLWFTPAIMAVASAAAALLAVHVDLRGYLDQDGALAWMRFASTEAVRQLLASIISALISVLSVVLSITIVALVLAASQLGPRLLRKFMRDAGNQVAVGVFVSTFLYCLIVFYAVAHYDKLNKIPQAAVVGAFLLAVLSVGVLIYFIHHVADFIQAPRVVAAVAEELDAAIEEWAPHASCAAESVVVPPREEGQVICSKQGNYLQGVDTRGLVALARRYGIVIQLLCRPGDFVAKATPLFRVYGRRDQAPELEEELYKEVVFGIRRTATQDVEYVLLELVEIALRALSPSLNDPFTAISCIDRLGDALVRLTKVEWPARYHCDAEGNVRVILDQTSFAGTCDAAFNQIRQACATNAAVIIRMFEIIRTILDHARNEEQRDALWRQAVMLQRNVSRLPEPFDREDAERRFQEIRRHYESGQPKDDQAEMQ